MQGSLSPLNPAVVSFIQGLTLHIHMAAKVLLEPLGRERCPSPSLALTLTRFLECGMFGSLSAIFSGWGLETLEKPQAQGLKSMARVR